ncbi:MAG TPA: hypothetical protein VGN40_08255, partial [Lelliottia sp.]
MEDPELPFFGSQVKKRRKRIGQEYAYALHLHMLSIYKSVPVAYTSPMREYSLAHSAYEEKPCAQFLFSKT